MGFCYSPSNSHYPRRIPQCNIIWAPTGLPSNWVSEFEKVYDFGSNSSLKMLLYIGHGDWSQKGEKYRLKDFERDLIDDQTEDWGQIRECGSL